VRIQYRPQLMPLTLQPQQGAENGNGNKIQSRQRKPAFCCPNELPAKRCKEFGLKMKQ